MRPQPIPIDKPVDTTRLQAIGCRANQEIDERVSGIRLGYESLAGIRAIAPAVDLVRSKYEIGGNGFHTGLFLSGSVSPTIAVPIPPAAWMSLILLCGLAGTQAIRRTRLAA
jgi:hypothetical protein